MSVAQHKAVVAERFVDAEEDSGVAAGEEAGVGRDGGAGGGVGEGDGHVLGEDHRAGGVAGNQFVSKGPGREEFDLRAGGGTAGDGKVGDLSTGRAVGLLGDYLGGSGGGEAEEAEGGGGDGELHFGGGEERTEVFRTCC